MLWIPPSAKIISAPTTAIWLTRPHGSCMRVCVLWLSVYIQEKGGTLMLNIEAGAVSQSGSWAVSTIEIM